MSDVISILKLISIYGWWVLSNIPEFLCQVFYSVKSVLMNFAEQQHRRLLLEIPKMDGCTRHIVYRFIQKEMYQKTRTVFATFRLNKNGTLELLRFQFRYYHILTTFKEPFNFESIMLPTLKWTLQFREIYALDST